MSKAFVKDDDQDSDEPLAPAPTPAAGGAKAPITAQGFQRLQDELDHLWKVERPKVANEVMWAAAQGDRSENAEYIYGKRRLREIDRRMRFLAQRLDGLTVVAKRPEHTDRVYFGAYVELEDEDGKRAAYRLVGSDEIDLQKGWISIESPIAKALLGKARGDTVLVVRPKGEAEFTVLSIRYEGEP